MFIHEIKEENVDDVWRTPISIPVQDHERQSGEEGAISSYEQPQANYPQMSPPLQ